MKRERKTPATVRVFNIVLTYDTERKDSELENHSIELVSAINQILRKSFPQDLPQFSIEVDTKNKLKISVRPHEEDETEH